MANYDVSNPDFSTAVEQFTIKTPAHANNFNEKFLRFLKNDEYLKEQLELNLDNSSDYKRKIRNGGLG